MIDYKAKLREKDPDLSDLSIERSILRGWKKEWSQDTPKYGHSWAYHFQEYLKIIFPKTDWHPFYQRQAEAFERTCYKEEKKILNVIGAASTGKTDWFASFALGMTSIYPDFTNVFVAAPFLSSAESTIWARILSRLDEMKEAHPDMWIDVAYVKSKNRIDFNNLSERGSIELKTLDKVSKLQGVKSYDPEKGFLILLLDEVALFPNLSVIDLLANLRKNANFFCKSGCNFKSVQTTEGQLCEPYKREYSDLDVDADQEWASAYMSNTVRLDGKYSPNVLAGKVIYPYLITQKEYDDSIEMYGEHGPKHMEQGRSFPVDSVSDSYVTSREKIRAGGGYDTGYVLDVGRATRVAFLDPGFGGDDCKIGAFEFSSARLEDSEGKFNTAQIFRPITPIITISLEVGKIADQEWADRLHAQSKGSMMLVKGQPVTMENQQAVQAGEFLDLHGVPRENFGFDGSMRASIVQELISVLGSRIQGVDSLGTASDRVGDLTGHKEANELYYNQVTEYWFNMAMVIQRGQMREADMITPAISQLCRRQWKSRGQKKQIETKKDYKKANQGKSPDDADVLCGAMEIAIRKGFAQMRRGRPVDAGGANAIIGLINGAKRLQFRTAKKLNR